MYQAEPANPSWDNSWSFGRGQFAGYPADWFNGIIDEVRLTTRRSRQVWLVFALGCVLLPRSSRFFHLRFWAGALDFAAYSPALTVSANHFQLPANCRINQPQVVTTAEKHKHLEQKSQIVCNCWNYLGGI